MNLKLLKLKVVKVVKMRCKVTCNAKIPNGDSFYLYLSPVVGGSEENKEFFKWTPGGCVYFYVVDPSTANQFELGKSYYVDFSPAE